MILSVGQDGQSINYTVNMGMITNPQMASIYLGGPGTTGAPVVTLWNSSGRERDSGSFSGVMATGTITAKDLTGPMQGKTMDDLLAAMKSGNTYVNFLTVQAPDDAARGEIVSMENNHRYAPARTHLNGHDEGAGAQPASLSSPHAAS